MIWCDKTSFRYIEERSFKRFVEACLEETIVVYVDHLLTQVICVLQSSDLTDIYSSSWFIFYFPSFLFYYHYLLIFAEKLHQGGNHWEDEVRWGSFDGFLQGIHKCVCKFPLAARCDIWWLSFMSLLSIYVFSLKEVESRVRLLGDPIELASAESFVTFTLVYTNILEHHLAVQ